MVVERFTGIQTHLDGDVLQTDGDLAFLTVLVLQGKLSWCVQTPSQCVDGVACKFRNNMVVIALAILVNVFDDTQCDLREVELTNHRITHYKTGQYCPILRTKTTYLHQKSCDDSLS